MTNYGFVKSITFGVPVMEPNGSPTLPENYEISDQLPDPINQGSRGICVSLCVTDMLRYLYKTTGKKPYRKRDDFFYNHRSDKQQDGMSVRNALEIAKAYNLIQSYAIVRNPVAIKLSILAHGPVLVAVPVYHSGETNFWCHEEGEKPEAYHAVLLTGYTPKSFILRNSWGRDWGLNGYTTVPIEETGIFLEAWTIFK